MNKNMTILKNSFLLFTLCFGYAASFTLPYIRYAFYDQMIVALACSNAQAAYLMSLYGIGNIISFIPGGYIADRYSPKHVVGYSVVLSGVFAFILVFNLNYSAARILWLLMPISSCFAFWAGINKAVRLLGPDHDQGKIFGFFNLGIGGCSTILAALAVVIAGMFGADLVGGFKGVLYFYGSANILAGIIILVFYETEKDFAVDEDDKFKAADILLVAKNPMTWTMSILIFCSYGIFTNQAYFTPYMTSVLGMTVTFGSIVGIARNYLARFICAPIGGVIADRIGSPGKLLTYAFSIMFSVFAILLVLPRNTSPVFALVLQIILAVMAAVTLAIQFSCISEIKIPRKLTGSMVAIVSIVGYSPDLILTPLFGHWIDVYESTGYSYIFATLAATAFAGAIASFMVYKKGLALKRESCSPEIGPSCVSGACE